ncbi:MAG: phosphotransferase [Candidatus Woesearchaeota archaeon]|jgi:hypothetical protein
MSTYLDEFQIDPQDHSYQLHPDSTLDHQGGREDTGRRDLDETIPCKVEEGAGTLGGLGFHAWVYTTADGRVERDLYPLGRRFGSDNGEESFLERLIVRLPEPEEEVLFLTSEELERYPANGYKWMHANPEIKRRFDGTILDRKVLNRFVSYEGLEITVAEGEVGIHIDTTVVPKVHGDNSQIDSLDLIVYETENARLVSYGTAVKIELKINPKNRVSRLKTSNPGEYLNWEGNLNLHTITQRVWEAQKDGCDLTSAEKEEFDRKLLEYVTHVNIPFLAKLPDPVLKRMFKRKEAELDSLVDQLVKGGIPEEVIEANKELSDYIIQVERNEVVSANRTFYVTDKDGQKWLLKTTQNERKARMEAAANYYLSQQFDFIVPGKQPEPLQANGVYMNLQRDVSNQPKIDQPLEYWIACLALFHREAESIMAQYMAIVPVKQLRGIDALAEDYAQAKKTVSIKFDRVAMAEAIDYLVASQDLVFGHGDNKKGNRLGKYLVDLEGCGKVHPGIDLSLLLMEYNVPKDQWSQHLSKYLELRGYSGSREEELKSLEQGTVFAARYTAVKEVLGSSLRNSQETAGENQLLRHQLSCLN